MHQDSTPSQGCGSCFTVFFSCLKSQCRRCHAPVSSHGDLLHHQVNCGYDLKKELEPKIIVSTDNNNDDQLCDVSVTKCKYCNLEVSTINEYHGHIHDSHPEAMVFHTCHVCHEFFRFTASAKRHVSRVHPNSAFQCDFCLETFSSEEQVKTHLAGSHPDASFQCTLCPATFASVAKRQQHMVNVHLKEKKVCVYCPFRAETVEAFEAHLNQEHPDRVKEHTCQDCNKTFFTISNLQSHRANVHRMVASFCDTCGKGFKSLRSLKAHFEVVHRKSERPQVTCEICGFTCTLKTQLRQHVKTVHGPKNFVCETCGKTFSDRSTLRKHRDHVHLNLKYAHCSECEAKFSTNGSLRLHMQRVHLGIKTLKCPTCCRRDFKDKEALDSHLSKGCNQKKRKSRAKIHEQTIKTSQI